MPGRIRAAILAARAAPAILGLALIGNAHAATRNEKVYQAVETNSSVVLDLLKEIVNIDSERATLKAAPKLNQCSPRD